MTRPDILVLCYHAVSEHWDWRYSVTPAVLEDQVRTLLERGYRATTFEHAVIDPPTERTLAVTFDDGFRSVAVHARPVLDRLGVRATVFVPTDSIGGQGLLTWSQLGDWVGGPHERELGAMSWDDARALRDAGWEIGSHTRSHPRLSQLDGSALRNELEGSRLDCERQLGQPCVTLAYPHGDADARVLQAASDSGYKAAATTAAWTPSARALAWPRVVVTRWDTGPAFLRKVSWARRRVRASPIGRLRAAARRGVNAYNGAQ
jgi:peptidoglycan/xylan/chitin deacetylase (PgdA/CDA1 family)